MSAAIKEQLMVAYRGAVIMLIGVCGFFLVKTSNKIDDMEKTLITVRIELAQVKTKLGLTTFKTPTK